VFEALFRRLALSVDWSQQYATIDSHCRKISQLSFLDLAQKGEVYHSFAPTVWDVDYKSAVAQAEIEDREIAGAFHDITFEVEGGGSFTISTTRPELLAACIAVVAHPTDARYQHLFGKQAITPIFKAPVPIMPAEHADPEKGTGILMVCTFGDLMDVEFWKRSRLPLKQIIGLDGRILNVAYGEAPFDTLNGEQARSAFASLVGLTVKQAQKRMVELLREAGALASEPRVITHAVKFYEKGDRPLEFVPTRQWFIRILAHRDALIEQGRKIEWVPSHMRTRYENWVLGLNQDWCVSRQRYFGVPFPVWYPINEHGEVAYDRPIFAEADSLPIDPYVDVPKGFSESQRGMPGGFIGDPDVMDTWATSSMTPQIASHWGIDEGRHQSLFPADVRPQAHEIIRTWAFYTVVKAYLHDRSIPWKHALISGWVLDPDRKKMSKSKGNVITPDHLFEKYSSDAIRYWAGRARLGTDTATDETVFKIGQKLVTKMVNASKFALMQIERSGATSPSEIQEPLDLALISRMRTLITTTTEAFDRFEYGEALQRTEEAFWFFCDHYIEMVKTRAYTDEATPSRQSACATLRWTLETFLRLFAPFLPFVTEEIWSWTSTARGSVHRALWPTIDEIAGVPETAVPAALDAAVEVVSKIRGAKTEARRSLKWPVSQLEIRGSKDDVDLLLPLLDDVLRAGNVPPSAVHTNIGAVTEGRFDVVVTLATEEIGQ
jgi:valyl-tRNA synthetase